MSSEPPEPDGLGAEAFELPAEWEVAPERGWVAAILGDELPGLGLRYTTVATGSGPSPDPVKARLRVLSDRFGGRQAIQLRQRPIPAAYRVFFRHIGLDPDTTFTPVEQAALERMQHGSFKSVDLLADALTIATVESGVAVRGLDADRIEGRLGIRPSAPGEQFEGRAWALPADTLVIADEKRPLEVLFGETAEGHAVGPDSERTALVAIGVRGVPEIALEEALWLAASTLRA